MKIDNRPLISTAQCYHDVYFKATIHKNARPLGTGAARIPRVDQKRFRIGETKLGVSRHCHAIHYIFRIQALPP